MAPGVRRRDAGDLLLQARGLSKAFPGTQAVDDVDFDLRAGEVHCLVGQNGSGKSTLIKILAGFHTPDEGSVTVANRLLRFGEPRTSREVGLRFVHQNLALVDALDTVDNLALGVGYTTRAGGRIDWRRARRDAEHRIRSLGYTFDVTVPIADLAPAERTGVAIARALEDELTARVLVADEPTAALTRAEVAILFEAIRRLRDRGVGIIYVSHRLDEVCAVADRITVLRDGRKVGTYEGADIDQRRLFELMIGQEQTRPPGPRGTAPDRPVVLDVRGLRGEVVDSVSFAVQEGEVVGFAGLTGSGRDEILSLIFGASPRGGEVVVDGRAVPAADPRAAMAAGISMVPADRAQRGSLPEMTVLENVTVTDLGRHSDRWGRLSRRSEEVEVASWINQLDMRPRRHDAVFATLSGGNQQKVVLAKWLRMSPRVLILDEPTQGVDIHAKATIHALARQATGQGAAVLVASSEDEELCETCDRVLVMKDGDVITELEGDRLTVAEIGRVQVSAELVA